MAKADGTVIQKSHYYPFGMAFAESTDLEKQPYKYNGKELEQEHQLNMYDYHARQMEPSTGRFTSVDPLAEKYYSWSPYAYVMNNPLKYIDPTGMWSQTSTGWTTSDTSEIETALNNLKSRSNEAPVYDSPTDYVDKDGKSIIKTNDGHPNRIERAEELTAVTVEADRIYPSPDFAGINYSGSAILGIGITGGVTIGIIPNDGLFTQISLGIGAGFDISHSINYVQGTYKGIGKPTARSLEGHSRNVNVGAYFGNGGYSQDYVEIKNPMGYVTGKNIGYVWQTVSGGVTIGSKSIAGGSTSLPYTFGTFYLYKK